MSIATKSLLAAGSVGTLTGAGFAINHFYGGKEEIVNKSIKEHIEKEIGSKFKFISFVEAAKEALKTRYERGSENKPKNGNVVVGSDKIVEWCENSKDNKFSKETDDSYLAFKSWCFVNITPLSEKAKKNSKIEYVSQADGQDNAWKTAWEAYRDGKSQDNLTISDSSLADLNNSDRDKGGVALHAWCKKTNEVKEYEVDSEITYKRYEKWCFKIKEE